jgi:hypothetical protein
MASLMTAAALVAAVLPGCPMVDAAPVGAVDPATTQLRIERVECVRVDRAGLLPADERTEMLRGSSSMLPR